jgi:DNA-binding response OmpR family regulator
MIHAKRILIIDDEVETAETISEYLNSEGFLSKFIKQSYNILPWINDFNPDLIVCDVMMEHISAIDILHTLRHNPSTAKIPIIFMSTKNDNESIIGFLEAGAHDYIVKPFALENLAERINYILSKTQQEHTEKLRVLVADNSKVILKKTVEGLCSHGFVVQGFSTAKDIIEILRNQPVDVVISGIKLNDDSGFNLCRKVKEISADIIFLLLVSDGNTEAICLGNKAGMDDFISKKLGFEGVLLKLRKFKNKNKRSIVSYNINERAILDVIQSCEQKGFTGKIEIKSEKGNGFIEMKSGQYLKIVFGKLKEADALEALTNLNSGNLVIKQEQLVI